MSRRTERNVSGKKDETSINSLSKEDKNMATDAESSRDHDSFKDKKKISGRRGKGGKPRGNRNSTYGPHPKDNNWRFYISNPSLAQAAADLSFYNASGLEVPVPVNSSYRLAVGSNVFPGIMCINVQPVFGLSVDRSSALNNAFDQLYAFDRSKNSGAINYAPADLAIYCMAMDSATEYWQFLTRVYGSRNVFQEVNRYIPQTLIRAMGVNYNDVIKNAPDLWWYINWFKDKLMSFAIPANMPIIARHNWLYANIFKEAESDKSQIWFYNPDGFYKFDETTSDQGGMLEYVGLSLSGGR